MLYYRVLGLKNFYYGVLMLLFTVLFWGLLFCVEHFFNPNSIGYDNLEYLLYNIVAVGALTIAAMGSGRVADSVLWADLTTCHQFALTNVVSVSVAILAFSVLTKDNGVSRSFLLIFFSLMYFLFFFSHQFIPRILMHRFFRNRYYQRALLVGDSDKIHLLDGWRTQATGLGLEVKTVQELIGQNRAPVGNELELMINKYRINNLILDELPSGHHAFENIVEVCNRTGTRLLVINNLAELFKSPVSFFRLNGLDVIQVKEEPLENPINRVLKRILDVAIALPVVVFVLPFLAVAVGILHRLQSPGPLFYRQTRAGISRRPFRILKFRTMHVATRGAAKQATANDNRVFSTGRWLRKTSLDEFPQFINVLLGDMSIVGPRPHMIVHDRRFRQVMDAYHVRNFVKPGITGLAQVKGYRGEAVDDYSIAHRVKYDIEYLQDWSIKRDLWIVFETAKQVIAPPDSAY
jgi:exopolysaccharide biosynthesis polyprenyl glycosylphosphotransferase